MTTAREHAEVARQWQATLAARDRRRRLTTLVWVLLGGLALAWTGWVVVSAWVAGDRAMAVAMLALVVGCAGLAAALAGRT